MANDKLPFASWCDAAGISKDTVASLAEASGYKPEEELTEAQFHRAVPLTVEDFLKYAAPGVTVAQREEFLVKFNLLLEDTITAEDFKAKLAAFKAEQQPIQSGDTAPQSGKKIMYTPAGCSLKYKKRWLLPGDKSNFADLSDEERSLLLDQGKIKKI